MPSPTDITELQQQQHNQIKLLLLWLTPIVFIMGCIQLILGIWYQSTVIQVSSIPTFCFLGLCLISIWCWSRYQHNAAVTILSTSFFAIAIILFLIEPSLFPILVIGPILAVVVMLPYSTSQHLARLSIIAWCILVTFAFLWQSLAPNSSTPKQAIDWLIITVIVGVSPILLLLLWQFHRQLTNSLAQALAANNTLTSTIEEVQAARAAAEQASELKTQFLANMSHELRTPLNSIINFTRILNNGLRGPVTPEQQDYLQRVQQSGEHLLGLINDILDLTKIESGRMDLQIEPIDLTAIIQSVMSTTAGLTKGKPIILKQIIEPSLPPVLADHTRLRQILLNLLSNAAKFTSQGHIIVRAEQHNQHIIVSVNDTGIGIAPEDREVIFEEFRQLEGKSNRRYEGTGLGLAICKRLVLMLNGNIWVESKLGVGSTFSFSLPIVPQNTNNPIAHAQLASNANNTQGASLLVIDDDPSAVEIIATYLENDGYKVYGLSDSRFVLDEVRQMKPAAIILDIKMPHRDGWQVLTDLKSDPQLQDIPILLYTIEEDRKLGFYLGANAYLTKPIDIDLLRTTLQQLLGENAQKILVIDDEENMREVLKTHLESLGSYQIITADGGANGLKQVIETQPDLIILDLMMPDIDGFAVLNMLEQQPQTQQIPVIILTAKELDKNERKMLQHRVHSLLTKNPTSTQQLIHQVRHILTSVPSCIPLYEKD